MAREDPHFRLRIPQDVKEFVEEAAHVNRRSITAEIVARLRWSFEAMQVTETGEGGTTRPMSANDYRSAMSSIVMQVSEKIREARDMVSRPLHPTDENTVYVILDTDGMPISWHEILTHLGELNRAAGLNIASQQTFVFTPEMISSGKREAEETKLIMEYAKRKRAGRKARRAKPDPTNT